MLDLARDIFEGGLLAALIDKHAESMGFSPAMLNWGMSRMASHWTADAFVSLVRREAPVLLQDESAFREAIQRLERLEYIASFAEGLSFSTLFLVSASTVPSASFQDVMLPLLLPLELSFRPSRRLAPFFEDVFELLMERYPILGRRLRLIEASHRDEHLLEILRRHEVVNVSGSRSSIEHFQSVIVSLPERERPVLVEHGHRLSAMILRRHEFEVLDEAVYASMALDLSVWDQEGCLSPKCLFFEGDVDEARKLAKALISVLDILALELPEVAPSLEVLAMKNGALKMAQLEGAQVFCAKQNHDVIVLHPLGASFQPLFLPRCLNVYLCEDAEAALSQLSPYGQAAGSLMGIEETVSLHSFGYNYFPRFGQMQDPPLDWLHDGIGTLKPLLREGQR